MIKVHDSDLGQEEKSRASSYIDGAWLQHLGLLDKQFPYHEPREEPVKAQSGV